MYKICKNPVCGKLFQLISSTSHKTYCSSLCRKEAKALANIRRMEERVARVNVMALKGITEDEKNYY